MRASRLLSMLLLLQTRGRMTAQELADELEVSLRTVYRDADSLSAAGIPIYADRGPAGGYQLLDGYRTRLTGLTADEADSLFLAGMPGPAAELGFGEVLAAAQLKLLAALPRELRDRTGRIRERFHLDAPGWFHDHERTESLTEIADAVWNQRVLHVRYQRWGPQNVERRLEPLGLVLKAGVWYLVANSSGQLRTYRISRMSDVEVLDEHFVRPEEFDLERYWQEWQRQFQARLFSGEAIVHLTAHGLELLPLILDPYVAQSALASARPSGKEGWTEVTLAIESVNVSEHSLFRFGKEAEIISPPELRARFVNSIAAMTEMYGTDPATVSNS
jgi:predicted DNA-binding transcriptional regulator YafY